CVCKCAIGIRINVVWIVILQPDFAAFSNLPCQLHSVSPFESSNLSCVSIHFHWLTSLCPISDPLNKIKPVLHDVPCKTPSSVCSLRVARTTRLIVSCDTPYSLAPFLSGS